MHAREIPYGDVAVFGSEFLRDFYHGVLLDDADFVSAAFVVDGEVAGFASFTRDWAAIRRRAVRRHALLLAWLLAKACLRHPRRLVQLIRLVRSAPVRSESGSPPPRAVALSLAVTERFRTPEFFQRTGLRIGRALYLYIGATLYRMGERRAGGETRSDNVLAQATLRSLGWRVVGSAGPGRDLDWVWDLDEAARRFGFRDDPPS